MAENFTKKIFEIQYSATKVNKTKRKTVSDAHPWSGNQVLRRLRKERDKIKSSYKSNPTQETKLKLTTANIKVYEKYNEAKNRYFARMIEQMGDTRRNFYEYMRKKKIQKTNLPDVMMCNGIKIEAQMRFSAMNDHFKQAYSIDTAPLPSDRINLELEVNRLYDSEYRNLHQNLWEEVNCEISANDVIQKINALKKNSDPGPMQIFNYLLQACPEKVAIACSKIFTLLLKNGTFPDSWKSGFIIPIPKQGKPQNINNYRGVCIESMIPKIFDSILTSKLQAIVEKNLPESQHGFVSGKGTISNLLELTHFVGENITGAGQVDSIYLDLSRAFDKISHRKLITKLCKLSFPRNFVQVIAAFICNRIYHLKIDGQSTGISHSSTSAVPQGSHLGPLLYILFCIDLPKCTDGTKVKILSYADDTKIFSKIESNSDADELQQVMDKIMAWLNDNGLVLNREKTFTMTFSRQKTKKYYATYYVDNHPIEEKEEMRDLGVIFDVKLNFNAHKIQMEKRSRSMHGAAYRFANEIKNQKIIMNIVQTYVTPILEYASVVWRRDIWVHEKKIENSQRFATRLYLKLPYSVQDPRYRSYKERLVMCNLISMEQRAKIAGIIFACRCMKGDIKAAIADTIRRRRITQTRTRAPMLFETSNLPIGGPLRTILTDANNLRGIFILDESLMTTRRKLKEYFLAENRSQ